MNLIKQFPAWHIVFAFVWVATCAPFLSAQKVVVRNYGPSDGIGGSEIYCLASDHSGRIWLGTNAGAFIFDGQEFTSLTTTNGLADNDILNIFEDSKNRIWLLSYSGKISIQTPDGNILNPDNHELLASLPITNAVIDFFEDDEGYFWIGTFYEGAFRIDPELKTFETSGLFLDSDSHGVRFLGMDKENDLIAYTGKGLANLTSEKFISGKSSTLSTPDKVLQTTSGHYLLARKNGLFEVGKEENLLYNFTHRTLQLRELAPKEVWVGTYDGAMRGTFSDGSFVPTDSFLTGYAVTDILSDFEGNLWFSTLHSGLFYIPEPEAKVFDRDFGFPKQEIRSLGLGEDHSIWVGFQGGNLGKLDPGLNFRTFFDHKPERGSCNDIFIGNDQSVWAISEGQAIRVQQDGTVFRYPWGGKMIFQTRSDSLFMSSYRITAILPPGKADQVSTSWFTDHLEKGVQGVFAMAETPNGELWLGTLGGLYRRKSGTYEKPEIKDPHRLLQRRISALKVDGKGRLWGTTFGWGVFLIEGDSVLGIGEDKGLSGNICNGLFIDKEDGVWVATNSGLNKIRYIDPLTHSFQVVNYGISEGLPSLQVNDVVVHDHKVWAGTQNGLSTFDEFHVLDDPVPPRIRMSGFWVNGVQQLGQALPDLQSNDQIEMGFQGISFVHQAPLTYQYQLLPLDQKWNQTTNSSITYNSLEPGEYTFRVMTRKTNAIESAKVAEVSFRVAHSKLKWLMVAALALLLAVAFFLLIRKLIRQQKALEEQAKVKSEATKQAPTELTISKNGNDIPIPVKDILWIKAAGHYVHIHTSGERYTKHSSMKAMQKELESLGDFRRVHRSYIVAFDKVDQIKSEHLIMGEHTIPIGDSFRDEVRSWFGDR